MALAIASLRLGFGHRDFPAFDGDATTFAPLAVNEARGDGMVNHLWEALPRIDDSGKNRLVFHGWLYQKAVADLFRPTDYHELHVAFGAVEAITVLLLGAVLVLLPRPPSGAARFVMAVASVFALGAVCTGMNISRPEPGATLVVTLWLLALSLLGAARFLIPTVVATALLFVITPVGGILMGFVLATWIALRHPWQRALKLWLVSAAALAILILGLFLAYYPYPVADWLKGIVAHARMSVVNYNDGRALSEYVKYWVANPNFTFHLFFFAAALVAVSLLMRRQKEAQSRSPLTWLALAGLAGATVYFVGRNPPHYYNTVCFAPALAVALVHVAGNADFTVAWRKCAVGCVCVGVLAAASLGCVRQALLFPWFIKEGMGYAEARAKVLEIAASHPGGIQASHALLFLQEDANKVRFISEHEDRNREPVLLLQQVNRGGGMPPETYKGCRLVWHNFSTVRPTFLGLPLSSSPQVYNFAVYARPGASSEASGKPLPPSGK